MTVFTVGKASIARIEETYGPTYRARDIFPEFDDRILAEHAGWLAPNHYDAASGSACTAGSCRSAARIS